jgi:hypothetical protein
MKKFVTMVMIALVVAMALCSVGEAGRWRGGCSGGSCGGGSCYAPAPVFYYAPPAPVFYQPMPVGPVFQAPQVIYSSPVVPVFGGCFGGACGAGCCR